MNHKLIIDNQTNKILNIGVKNTGLKCTFKFHILIKIEY